ncbi:MAG: hypothetical protein M3463_16650 [Verrucomicrobiota bacterium]|nr:hypothetical protein [Verrucomicrobiota bacterium]
MKTLTIKVPDALFADIAGDAKARNLTKSEVVRERLAKPQSALKRSKGSLWDRMEDLVIESDSLPPPTSPRTKRT